ncbi:hypothetical protein [Methylibium sp.]|uniref:hypothetical protein n=1 Tax=Methylibium sp. TaxID=2067992 RepID=UPI00286A3CAA|nr:hypothetical protein [Methylibium sp.]
MSLPSFHALQRCLAAALLLCAASFCVRGETLPTCRVDPFALAAPPVEREASLRRPCGSDQLMKLHVEPLNPAAPRSGVLRARIDNVVSEGLMPGLLGSVKLSWAGLGGEPTTGLRTERALLAAGSQLRVSDDWSVQMNLGRDLVSQRSRATAVGLWRPVEGGVLFAEWSDSRREADVQRVGARWWVMPRRLAIDVDSRHDERGWDAYRFNLTLSLKP